MAKTTENLQNTLSVELGGETIVSQPFDFEAFCLVDDMRYGDPPLSPAHIGVRAVTYMFRGTKLTEEKLEKLPFNVRRELCVKAANMFFDAISDESPKNE